MTEFSAPTLHITEIKDKLIVALDVETIADARMIVSELSGHVGAFKIGLQLFTSAGASFVREIADTGEKVFLDLKFHDIPNTVAKAAVEAARLGAWMFNVHALGGSEMMRRAVDEVSEVCRREKRDLPKIIAVTILTSFDEQALNEVGIEREPVDEVLKLAKLGAKCGLAGVVASPHEVESIRKTIPNRGFVIITPGIRPNFATNEDQRRVMTPKEAVAKGSDYLVIGRPITQAADRLSAVGQILEEMKFAEQ